MLNTPQTIYEAFRAIVASNPQKIAAFFREKGQYHSLLFIDLLREINTLTALLKQQAITKNDHVALIMHNCPSWIEAFLACTQIGALIIPINPDLEPKEIHYLLSHSEVKVILTDEKSSPKIQTIAQKSSLNMVMLDSEGTKKQRKYIDADEEIEKTNQGSDVACIIYTSGTTASPKGVQLTHSNLLSNVIALQKINFISSEDRVICLLPLYHAYSLMGSFLLPLLSGATISFSPSLDPQDMMDCIQQTHVTILVGVPRLFVLLKEKIERGISQLSFFKRTILTMILTISFGLRRSLGINCAPFILSNIHKKFGPKFRLFISGGAKLDTQSAQQLYQWGFTLLEGYGLTETSPVISFNTPSKCKLGSVGVPIPDVSVKIHEPDELGYGEIITKGKNVTVGYYKDDALTAQRIKNDWFSTGDIGRLDRRGLLYIYQRKDEAIVLSSGKKVNPSEIEAHYEQSPFIEEVCIFPLKGKNASSDALAAVVRPHYEQLHAQKIYQIKDRMRWEIENLSIHLPSYKRVTNYTLVTEPFPRTVLGKLKRYLIRDSYYTQDKNKVPPQPLNLQERELLTHPLCKKAYDFLCQEAKKKVSMNDNLELDIGFDSLQQITLLAEFESMAGNVAFEEKDFASLLTVKDVLIKLKGISPPHVPTTQSTTQTQAETWTELLSQPTKEGAKHTISIHQSPLDVALNIFFVSIFRLLFLIFLRVKIKGSHNLPSHGPMIICANHASYLDGPLLFCCLNSRNILNTYFLGYKAYFDHPLIAWAKRLLRLIPIDTSMEVAESLHTCSSVLEHNKNLCIFPAGRRSLDGNIQPFKKGIGILIKNANVPVVPVYIAGSFQAWPPYRTFPKPHKVTIHIGRPLSLKELSCNSHTEGIDNYANIMHNLREGVALLQRTTT